MRKMNMYFFGQEEISLHDQLWWYGGLGGAITLTAFVVGVTL